MVKGGAGGSEEPQGGRRKGCYGGGGGGGGGGVIRTLFKSSDVSGIICFVTEVPFLTSGLVVLASTWSEPIVW